MAMTTDDMYRLASDFASEHGEAACGYARRAVLCFEAEGAVERARFWFLLSVLLDDILRRRVDPGRRITIH